MFATGGELAQCLPMGRAGPEKIKHIHLDFVARERKSKQDTRKNDLLLKSSVARDIIF